MMTGGFDLKSQSGSKSKRESIMASETIFSSSINRLKEKNDLA
ncbi:hypothetical protein X744_07690 [Mesorhizobium sp. LNJC372A00]|nr:hypothetical protein X750_14100 [Mesorhizobium sp. LNJC394B00]ESY58256.1 hypothetical protein X745_00965 [Mesorhizobium sp. LNJC374B00]ESY60673.1 hypothetical protein X744_07690 [Mesorhizobium sp. LNJC372A00]ESZ77591.1 hypothetical protein X726_06250 [Mesorhizobium sp. L103C105A0]